MVAAIPNEIAKSNRNKKARQRTLEDTATSESVFEICKRPHMDTIEGITELSRVVDVCNNSGREQVM
jgi:hypothetical protein